MTEEIEKYWYEQCHKYGIATIYEVPYESKEEVDKFIDRMEHFFEKGVTVDGRNDVIS